MPLSLLSLEFAIVCEGNELETYDVKQEGPNSTTAFVASEAGKQFSINIKNNLSEVGLLAHLFIDGECIDSSYLIAGPQYQLSGIRNTASSVLPFKFQELELVDPDVENAPVAPDMGSIELRTFRCRAVGTAQYNPDYRLHQGRVSERSKKAGWHRVGTADEIPTTRYEHLIDVNFIDTRDAPYASIKVFYRPRELLMAQGVIVGHDAEAEKENRERPEVNNRKRARREDGLPGPSKRRTRPAVKKEEIYDLAQQIQVLQGKVNSLMATQSPSSVKRELRSSSPTVMGQAACEVIDLTLED
ncbi:hypothetical protein BJV77DRAFT_1068992 [Russula vinacea]|nr:hypothetical protein BJV77DRAFT_1068992 [Russula vinacea]